MPVSGSGARLEKRARWVERNRILWLAIEIPGKHDKEDMNG
jgi:hypothetical protein